MDTNTIVLPDGTTRRMGCLRPPAGLTKAWRTYGSKDDEPLIPRSEWPALIESFGPGPEFPFLPPQHDQNGRGQCCPEATTTCIESQRMSQGLPYVQLSPADLYDRINGGADNGSMLEDALHEATTNGVGTAATSGLIWNPGLHKAPATERARFRVLEFVLLPTFDHLMSALLKGRRAIGGVVWFNNYTPGPDGWMPTGQSEVGGHSTMAFQPAMRAVGGATQFGAWNRQSWGAGWHPTTNNCFVLAERQYLGPVGGMWSPRDVVDEGHVVPEPQA